MRGKRIGDPKRDQTCKPGSVMQKAKLSVMQPFI